MNISNKNMTFIDFFAGIGGFTAGLTQAGMKCVGYCENDKFALKSYTAMHSPKNKECRKEWFCDDITKARADEIPYADGWTAGFPCQDISVCGSQHGISGARSGLFFEIIRLLKGKSDKGKPQWLVFENVRNLVSVKEGEDFTTVLREISEAGYDCEWQIINSKLFVPQNRERVFIIGHFRGASPREVFPVTGTSSQAACEPGELIEIIGGSQGNRVYCSQGISTCLVSTAGGFASKTGAYCVGSNPCFSKPPANEQSQLYRGSCLAFIDLCVGNPKITNIARCIKARYDSGISNRCELSGVLANGRIRRLTPRECFRLQGFSDEMFDKAAAVNSDTQLYRQAGNSVTVPVIRAIGERLMSAYES